MSLTWNRIIAYRFGVTTIRSNYRPFKLVVIARNEEKYSQNTMNAPILYFGNIEHRLTVVLEIELNPFSISSTLEQANISSLFQYITCSPKTNRPGE